MIDTLSILGHYWRTRHRRAFHSRNALEHWQARQFHRFARRVLSQSPFYRPYVGRSLAEYPIIDKAVMMESFDQINTRGLHRDHLMALALEAEASRDFSPMAGEISVGLSSGTSGRRSLFAVSHRERQRYAGAVLAKALPKSLFSPQRVALLLRADNRLYQTINRSKRVSFAFFDLLLPFLQILRSLQEFDPGILIGPPQALRLVAEACAASRVRLSPAKILAGAEVLDPIDARIISRAFGRPIHQIYQAAEGFLGITCAHGTLHLNEEFILFERQWVDRSSRRFMPIVTDFSRSTQPIVRYRLDDVLIERPDPCPCGSVATPISRIEGRADDILFFPRPNHAALAPVMPDFLRDQLALCHAQVSDYRVIQHGPDDVELLVEGPNPAAAAAAALAAFHAALAHLDLRRPAVRLGGPIPLDLDRKLRRVQRRFPLPPEALWTAS